MNLATSTQYSSLLEIVTAIEIRGEFEKHSGPSVKHELVVKITAQ